MVAITDERLKLSIRRAVGETFKTLYATIATLYQAWPDPSAWTEMETGYLALVLELKTNRVFLKMISLVDQETTWEGCVTIDSYKWEDEYFHTYLGQEIAIGFSFCSKEDSLMVYQKIQSKMNKIDSESTTNLVEKIQNPLNAASGSASSSSSNNTHFNHPTSIGWETENKFSNEEDDDDEDFIHIDHPPILASESSSSSNSRSSQNLNNSNSNSIITSTTNNSNPLQRSNTFFQALLPNFLQNNPNNSRRSFSKEISEPLNFEHLGHIGWDREKGFDVQKIPESLNNLLGCNGSEDAGKLISAHLRDGGETFDCAICFNSYSMIDRFVIPECKHSLCRECTSRYFKMQIDESRCPILCPSCNIELSYNTISLLLNLRQKEKFLNFSLLNLTRENKNFLRCPQPNCEYIVYIPDDVFEVGEKKQMCDNCHEYFCIQCKIPYHEGQSCEELDPILKELVRKKQLQACPGCHAGVEKSDGCNHMTCKCGKQFCYLCGEDMDEDKNHFDQPHTPCYNKQFED